MQVSLGFVSWLNASQPILVTKGRWESWKNKNLGKLRASGQLHFWRARIVIGFCATISNYWFTGLFKTSGPLLAGQSLESAVPERNAAHSAQPPHIGMERRGRWNVRFRRLQRQPRPQCQRPPWRRTAPVHSTALAEVEVISMTCTFSTARRREGGICWRCFLEEFLGRFDEVWWFDISHLGKFRGDMRTFAKHHAIDRHVLRHLFFLVVFSFLCPCLETHVGMS